MSDLPFTKSRVEQILKKNLSDEQQVSQRVKLAMNEWLGELTAKISKEMAQNSGKTLTVDDFNKVVHKYEIADKLAQEKERVSRKIEETNKEIGKVIRDFEKSIVKKEDEEAVRIVQLHADEEFEDDY